MNARILVDWNTWKPRLHGDIALAYAAGLFDGEGCVHIARRRMTTARRGHVYRLTTTISQNHLATLLDFQSLSGHIGRLYLRPRSGSTNRDSFALAYDGQEAADLLATLQPFLGRKAHEADVALQFQSETQTTRRFGRAGCPEEIWQQRQRFYEKLRNLK